MAQKIGWPVEFKRGMAGSYKKIPSSAAPTFDWKAANFQEMTLLSNVTCVHFKDAAAGAKLNILFRQGCPTGLTVTGWPACVLWFGRTAPTIGACPAYSDLISLICNGVNYWGLVDHDAGPTA